MAVLTLKGIGLEFLSAVGLHSSDLKCDPWLTEPHTVPLLYVCMVMAVMTLKGIGLEFLSAVGLYSSALKCDPWLTEHSMAVRK